MESHGFGSRAALLSFFEESGLLGAVLSGLFAVEVCQLSRASRTAHRLLSPDGLCCPYIFPSTPAAMRAALRSCHLPQLKSLRPPQELESDPFLEELVEGLGKCACLEELGPICIDESGVFGSGVGSFCLFDTWMPSLGLAFGSLRCLERLSLTLRCVHDSNALAESFIPALGKCPLKSLRLDLDTACSCGADIVSALVTMLIHFGDRQRLESLSLGYLWWTEASDEVLISFKEAVEALPSLRSVALRCPQDPELGALEAASCLLGATVEEVLVMDAWGHDGSGLSGLLEALSACPCLRRLDLIGELPEGFDAVSFQQALRQVAVDLNVCVNSPSGLKKAMHNC
ncbi:unnamed protein product [Effrenium voratum]|uniref:Uncharacterized protein n=1 Tax=Effrenium voratum TaxID=2562239 RepID=A0AA36NIU5_9DINO|nr:unnamed protein product [Effrenium voratum]CAJ1416210.1 unnamed protein product [Effrenium voratum]